MISLQKQESLLWGLTGNIFKFKISQEVWNRVEIRYEH